MASPAKKLKTTPSKSKSYAFTCEQDEILIELVAQNPSLYNLKPSYKDAITKENIWKDIGSALNKTSDGCRTRWKYIKDSYNRFKRKRKAGKRNSTLPTRSKWEFYDRLKFLELSSFPTEGVSNIPSISQGSQNEFMDTIDSDSDKNNDGDDDDIQSTIVNKVEKNASKENTNNTGKISKQNINNTDKVQKQNTNNTENAAPKKMRRKKQDEFIEFMKKRDIQKQALLKKACEEKVEKNIDDVDSFGDHIKAVLQKLPPILKVKAKAEIFNVMSKYELMSMEIHSTPSISSAVPSITPPTSLQEEDFDNKCIDISIPTLLHSDI